MVMPDHVPIHDTFEVMSSLRVLLLSDGRPGHYHLSEGIVAALARRGPVDCRRVDVRRGRWPGRMAAWLANARLPTGFVLWAIYGLSPRDLPAGDLVVSAGAETLAANSAISRHLGVPNIFYGSLRHFDPRLFTLVLSSYRERSDLPRQAFTMKPAAFDPDLLTAPEPPASWERHAPTIGIAIGGDAPGCRFTEREWERLLAFLATPEPGFALRWVVSNSRRTPAPVSDRLAALAGGSSPALHRFIDVREPAAPRLWDVFGATDAVLVTADSSTMLSEAIWSRRPVISLYPADARLDPPESGYRAWLEAQRWVAPLAIADLDGERLRAAAALLMPMTVNPLDELAALLGQRLFGAPARTPDT